MLKVEEKQLKWLQNISKIIGILSFAAFIVLLIFLGYLSYTIKQDIAEADSQLSNKNLVIENRQAEINKLDEQLANRQTLVNAQANTIKDISKDASKQTIKKVIENMPIAAESLPRIYLHIGNESEKKLAEKIAEKLQVAGYIVPRVEIVGELAPKTTQLRYCRNKEKPEDLNKIRRLLNEINISAIPVVIPDWIDCSKISVRSYELWLKSDTSNQNNSVKLPVQTKPLQTKKP